ncbi:MAG: LytTR family DNA-binding domain-containing protein [Clostridiaceae bacterium]
MKIEVKLDSACTEPRIEIHTDRMTDEINDLVQKLSESTPQILVGFRQEEAKILDQSEVVRAYASGGKVLAETAEGEYVLRLRLYELEERLDRNRFVRISNAEIINLSQVKGFDLSFAGTICVNLKNGTAAFVSRRYVAKIKQVLGI